MTCPACGLDLSYIDGVCGICKYSEESLELAEIEFCAEEDF